MKPTEFVKVNTQFWGEHLKGISEHLPVSHRRELAGPLLYPRMLVLTEAPDWNIVELVGISREYRSLEVRRQKVASVEEYFGVSGGPAVVTLPGENLFKDATVATQTGRQELGARFPGAKGMLGQEFVGPQEDLLKFAPGNFSTFDRTLLVHSAGSALRAHWVFFALAIHRSEPAEKYLDFLRNFAAAAPHTDPIGTLSVPRADNGADLQGPAFASTYLAHAVPNSTVEAFLSQNEDFLLSAFDATKLIRQPHLEWQSGGEPLTPDFILERADGTHVVGDLRLPLVDTAKGKRHKRTSSVTDGAARLARVTEYFENADNRAFASTKYGVEITAPRKLVVLGSQDLVGAAELKAAEGVEVLDFDTILRLHLAATTE
ncbi:hypothetical protein HPO96_19565 [Kribbella sandramycini]|uniref:Uncharacterized protein n=1 Tax=Kribbella sandramycini TaxID=60450 RepID=A0A7Y4L1A4_9ACTN|nr:hypothetical protein [Kribbella sandramycini]MBB6564747.1 hypothetical protein [Kribbella sandramycini]NOL42449.1 hypothetical protein [Kribbella sandramycini]